MEDLQVKVFEPKEESFKITPNMIMYPLIAIGIIGYFTLDELVDPESDLGDTLLLTYIFITLPAYLFFQITSTHSTKALNGTFNGYLSITNKEITIQKDTYTWAEIQEIDFSFNDYFGEKPTIPTTGNFNRTISQGVNNFIKLTLQQGETRQAYFRQVAKGDRKKFYPFIINMIKLGKISVSRGAELMGITNKHELEELSKLPELGKFVY
ncbi:hypothetical protein [Nibribacter koreensis]|uniref:Uncharacterized protein n=1 Tax=Nibribacter koreensis TaxID=1084519 RepID=A0ABP8FL16_9BACT